MHIIFGFICLWCAGLHLHGVRPQTPIGSPLVVCGYLIIGLFINAVLLLILECFIGKVGIEKLGILVGIPTLLSFVAWYVVDEILIEREKTILERTQARLFPNEPTERGGHQDHPTNQQNHDRS